MVEPADVSGISAAAIEDARATLEAKSRQIKPLGTLPELVTLRVRSQATKQHLVYQDGQLDTPEKQFATMPFEEVVKSARKTVLLGDLGSGKSSLVAKYVLERNESDDASLALSVPCKSLRLQANFRISELIDSFSAYFSQQVAPNSEPLNVKSLLNEGIEVVLLFDGLDELQPTIISHFIRQLAKLVGSWPNVQVVATGRPVELLGVSYDSWQVCEVCRLSDDEKREILKNEFISNGNAPLDADAKAAQGVGTLKNYPALNDVTVTPLALRLAADKLHALDGTEQPTLGDLLFALAEERLALWETREGRQNRFDIFSERCPTSIEKIQLLGRLALESKVNPAPLTRDGCTQLFAEYVSGGNALVVAEEAFSYFCENGLLSDEATVEFVFEPLKQLCAGAELLASWCDEHSSRHYELDDLSWRVVAFAAGIARRRNQLDAIHEQLRSCLRMLLCNSAGVAPSCYIVNESKAIGLAEFAIERFAEIERRPLWWDPNEEQASSRAIASTIVLAGDKGFAWLYESYLNPRVPLMHRGSAIISAVFRNWVVLVKDNLSETQRKTLAQMVNPYRAFDGMLLLFDKLVFLCPDEFTLPERLWLLAGQLGNADFGDHARNELMSAFLGSERELVNSILRLQATKSLEAALLFLELNQETVPREIAFSIIMFCSDGRNQGRITNAIDTCVQFFGPERWTAILRWCLASDDRERRLCANASRLLFEAGDRRFEVLAPALLDGTHDGLRAYRCEDYMEQLVAVERSTRTRFIANQIAKFNDRYTGAHSGWWRLLLANLDSMGEDAPAMLVECTRSIGPFLLPRNPDIRHTFRSLLKKSAYYDEFKKHLWDVDPGIRLGVGMVLSIVDPQREADAVLVTILGRPYSDSFGFYEWEELFLSLDFGYSVQEYVHSRLKTLAPQARALALAMLVKNGFALSHDWHDELRNAHLDLGNSSFKALDLAESHPSSQTSFEQYKNLLQSQPSRSTRYAAELLLQYHHESLEPSEEALCWLVLSVGGGLNADVLREQLMRLAEDREYRDVVTLRGTQLEAEFSTTPLLLAAAKAITQPVEWSNVVWTVFCDTNASLVDMDEACHGVFDFALLKPEFQVHIGQAAKSFLDDHRINKDRFTDKYHWLVLVAASFCELSKARIEEALCASSPIHGTASRGLVALLGYIPGNLPNYHGRRTLPALPTDMPVPKEQEAVESELKEISRESERLVPNTCQVIEDVVFTCIPSTELLAESAAKGLHGKFVAQCLRFCFKIAQSMKDRAAIIQEPFSSAEQWHDETRNGLIWIQNIAFRADIAESVSLRQQYLSELNRVFSAETRWNQAIVYEILKIAGRLEVHHIERAFCDYAQYQGKLHRYVAVLLVDWLTSELPTEEQDAVVAGAKKAIQILSQSPWDKSRSMGETPFPFLIFPLVIWRFESEDDDVSDQVFLRGIKELFRRVGDDLRGDLTEPFATIEPLLRTVPISRLATAITKGKCFPDPGVRSLVRILQSMMVG